jgi:hypothetical protein
MPAPENGHTNVMRAYAFYVVQWLQKFTILSLDHTADFLTLAIWLVYAVIAIQKHMAAKPRKYAKY